MLPIVIGAIVASLALHTAFGGAQTNFGDLDLGINTAVSYATHDGQPIHAKDYDDIDPVLAAWKERGSPPVGIFLGNSQIHGINQFEPGQVNVAAMLFDRIAPRGTEILTFTQASANLQEHFLLFEYLLPRLKPKFLVLPIVFMNMRDMNVRNGIAKCMQDPETQRELEQTAIGRRLLEQFGAAIVEPTPGEPPVENWQQFTERHLNEWLDQHWSLWRLRPEARGQIASTLIRARNTILGISGQSKRHLIPGSYAANLEALDAMLAAAKAHDVRVLVYIAPIRQDIEPPYFSEEYDDCRRDVEAAAEKYGAVYADLGDSVPAEFYGYHNARVFFKAAQPDFFHFQEGAHRKLADALGELIETRILNP